MSGRYWILTIPHEHFTPYLPPGIAWIRGQLELGHGGYLHWQLVCTFSKTVRLSAVTKLFGPFHAELSRSDAASAYVWKMDTRVDGTQFELGQQPTKRNCKRDWDAVWESAKSGQLDAIESGIRLLQWIKYLCL